jgi:endonuclease YncB( thermonuclease family)
MIRRTRCRSEGRALEARVEPDGTSSPGIGREVSKRVAGIPRIVDGDTVQIGETKIRLSGIDAPETDQVCFDPATSLEQHGRCERYARARCFGDPGVQQSEKID